MCISVAIWAQAGNPLAPRACARGRSRSELRAPCARVMRHSEIGAEPYELSTPLLRRHSDDSFFAVNALPSPHGDGVVHVPSAKGLFAADSEARRRKLISIKIVLYTSLWWMAAILVIVTIKKTVCAEGIYPHPFALTSFIQPMTALSAYMLSHVVYINRPQPPKFEWREVGVLLTMGTLQGMEIGLTNKALEYMTVAARTMISSTNVLFMMCTARLWGLEHLGVLRLISAAFLIGGGLLQGIGTGDSFESHSTSVGIGMQVVSMILSAQRWALAQVVLQRSAPESALGQTNKLSLLARTLPITGLVCLPLSLVFEPMAYEAGKVMQQELWLNIGTVAAALTAMLYAELQLVKRLSAVAFNVLATVHQIPIVLAGVVLQHNQVARTAAYGFACCLIGALFYAVARQCDRLRVDH